jgi:hypothetical protein
VDIDLAVRPVLRKTNNIFIVLFALGTVVTVVGSYLEKCIKPAT